MTISLKSLLWCRRGLLFYIMTCWPLINEPERQKINLVIGQHLNLDLPSQPTIDFIME